MATAETALFWTGAVVGVLFAVILVIMALLYRFIRTPEIRGRCSAGAWALFVAILAAPTAAAVVFWTDLTDTGLPWTVIVVLIEVWWMICSCLIGEFIDQRIWPRSRVTDASGKVALVTGGSRGIGLYTAKHMAALGATVVVASRRIESANAAAAAINSSLGIDRVSGIQLDLASLESVREAVRTFKKRFSELHILVNNGGFAPQEGAVTKEGYESGLGAMHFGHFLLTHELEPMMRKSGTPDDPARVVYVASFGHSLGKLHDSMYEGDGEGDLRGEITTGGGGSMEAYGRAKLANVLHAEGLTYRWREAGVNNMVAHSCHPGGVATDIWNGLPQPIPFIFNAIGGRVLRSSHNAGLLVAGMALDEHWGAGSGWYADCFLAQANTIGNFAGDPVAATALWATSEVACGLKPKGENHVGKEVAKARRKAGHAAVGGDREGEAEKKNR